MLDHRRAILALRLSRQGRPADEALTDSPHTAAGTRRAISSRTCRTAATNAGTSMLIAAFSRSAGPSHAAASSSVEKTLWGKGCPREHRQARHDPTHGGGTEPVALEAHRQARTW